MDRDVSSLPACVVLERRAGHQDQLKLDLLLVSQSLGQVDGLIGKTVTSMDGKIRA